MRASVSQTENTQGTASPSGSRAASAGEAGIAIEEERACLQRSEVAVLATQGMQSTASGKGMQSTAPGKGTYSDPGS